LTTRLCAITERISDPEYRPFANCLAGGLMGATDFNPGAIGNFEDPDLPIPVAS